MIGQLDIWILISWRLGHDSDVAVIQVITRTLNCFLLCILTGKLIKLRQQPGPHMRRVARKRHGSWSVRETR